MKKTHVVVIAIVLLLMVSLAFAQQGQKTYVSGDVAAVNTPSGVVLDGEQVSVTVPLQKHTGVSAKTVSHQQSTRVANQQAVAAKATHAQNAASLKKGEPALKVNTTTTQTDVYDVNIKNKRGTTDYGVVEQTVTNPQGQQSTQGVIYSAYSPSKAARANEKEMEVSIAAGETMSYNKDNRGDRYGTNGLAADISLLKKMSNHLAVGMDYMMLHPRAKTHGEGTQQRHYHGMYAHGISLAGKLTINPWNNWQVYMPMGVGMMNARMKTEANGANSSDDKWGAAWYFGVGLQYNVTDWMFTSLEYRYAYAFVNDKNLTDFHKDRNLQFHNLVMRVGMRF